MVGIVQNGVIVLQTGQLPPEGTQVRIEPVTAEKTLAERFASVIGQANDLPEDLAARHDHYLYGAKPE